MSTPSQYLTPRALCKVGGVMYLLVILLGLSQELFIRGKLFVPGDTVATAEGLRAMAFLWRCGLAMEIAMLFATVVQGWAIYCLLRPTSKDLSLLVLLFCLSAVAVEASYTLRALEALYPLGGNAYLGAWSAEQLAGMSYLSARAYVAGFGLVLLLFSPYLLVTGYLLLRSGYFPRAIGVLYMLPGVGYLSHGIAQILAPAFAGKVFMVIAAPAFVGELSLCLWLLFKGVDPGGWQRSTGGAHLPRPSPAERGTTS